MRIGLGRVLDLAQAHFLTDELLEFVGRNLAQPLEPRDLAALAQLLGGIIPLGLAVAVNCFLLVADAEQRRFQHEQMAVVDQLLEEPEEIRDH